MASIGVSKPELARLMGMSPQNIFAYFQRDNMRLSFAQSVVDRLGYELSFSLDRDTQSSLCEVEIELPQGMNRLAFLQIALQKYGISRKDLAEKLGLNYTGVNRWLHVDDMAISYIFDIAELYGLKVKTSRRVIKALFTETVFRSSVWCAMINRENYRRITILAKSFDL